MEKMVNNSAGDGDTSAISKSNDGKSKYSQFKFNNVISLKMQEKRKIKKNP